MRLRTPASGTPVTRRPFGPATAAAAALAVGVTVSSVAGCGGHLARDGGAASALPTAAPPSVAGRRGPSADVGVTTCRQDPTDDTAVVASGTIVDPLPEPADYTFTIQWYLGSMQVTQTSETLTGALPRTALPWSTQADLALAAGGPYSCRIVRVIRSVEAPRP